MSIRLLDELTINQIAAGEVVERPASVVKELVENALDAGATRIGVTISPDLIAVRDNGAGMSAADLHMAVRRHATSKIGSASDLAVIRSYGFRGEALPSIAAVSRLAIRTRQRLAEAGALLIVEGGQTVEDRPVSMPEGTQVAVSGLFYNTPVRAKFLRSERSEVGRAVSAVERLALARHDVAFEVEVNGRQVLRTPGTGDPRETLLAVYGVEAARDAAFGHAAVADGGEVHAIVGGPATARSDRRRQGVFVNGRPVYARGMLEAAEAACPQGLLPGRQRPLLLLYLDLPPARVDANVHPTKAEVRFAGENAIFAAIVQAVRASAGSASWFTGDSQPVHVPPQEAHSPGLPGVPPGAALLDHQGGYHRSGPAHLAEHVSEAGGPWRHDTPHGALPDLRPLGQAGGKWIVCDGPGGVYLIDQHAAHERVQFERLQEAGGDVSTGGLPAGRYDVASGREGQASQLLAVPTMVELSPAELSAWHDFRAELAANGMDTEEFGGATVVVRSLPVVLADAGGGYSGDPASLLREVLAALAAEGPAALSPRLRARRALASCVAAVKATMPLSAGEQAALVRDLAACSEPLRCPHGRPTIVRLTDDELARRFGRS